MSLVVVDASALVCYYIVEDSRHDEVKRRLTAGHALFAPAHMDAEVVSALRGMARGNSVLHDVVPSVLRHLAGAPIRRKELAPLLDRIWQLRDNVTPYDAAYIALAEDLDGPLITCDAKLAGASGVRCAVDLIT